MKETNLSRLAAAAVADPKVLTDSEKELIETLSQAEVETLIRIRKKLGPARSAKARPDFPV